MRLYQQKHRQLVLKEAQSHGQSPIIKMVPHGATQSCTKFSQCKAMARNPNPKPKPIPSSILA